MSLEIFDFPACVLAVACMPIGELRHANEKSFRHVLTAEEFEIPVRQMQNSRTNPNVIEARIVAAKINATTPNLIL